MARPEAVRLAGPEAEDRSTAPFGARDALRMLEVGGIFGRVGGRVACAIVVKRLLSADL